MCTRSIRTMTRESKDWKKLTLPENRGPRAYIEMEDLLELEREGAIDLDKPLEYSVSVGISDGRARAFVQIRNRLEDD